MLTKRTQIAISILHEIAYRQGQSCPEQKGQEVCPPECIVLLDQLCAARIISLLPNKKAGCCSSYILSVSLSTLSLYELLLAIGESINMVSPMKDEESIYKRFHYGAGALRLGVINQTLRTMLCDIHLTDF